MIGVKVVSHWSEDFVIGVKAVDDMAHLHQRKNTRTKFRPNSRCIIIHWFLWKPSTPRPKARRGEKSFAKCHESSSEYSSKSL